MTDMICDNCNRYGIRWMGRLTELTHTECPHCGGKNCQRMDEYEENPPIMTTHNEGLS
jgi:Ribonuclease G/E